MTTRSAEERREWIRNGGEGWLNDGKGRNAMNRFQMAEATREASTFDGVSLLRSIEKAKTVRAAEVGGRKAIVVEAKGDGDRVWLYFDAQNGLLVRKRRFFQSLFLRMVVGTLSRMATGESAR